MSDLPQIDQGAVIQRLSAQIAGLTTQVASLEVLAEALRDERNSLQEQIDGAE